MKKHMKSANMQVMLGLLAVLFISLAYLSMQGREGMAGLLEKDKKKEKEKEKEGFNRRDAKESRTEPGRRNK